LNLQIEFRFNFLSRVYGSRLQILFYRSTRLVKFMGSNYASHLMVSNLCLFCASGFWFEFMVKFSDLLLGLCLRDHFTIDFIG